MPTKAIATLYAKGAEFAAEREGLLRRAEALTAIAALECAIAILDPAQHNGH